MKKKVALVVGSSRGIGATIVEELVKQDYDVIVTYKDHMEDALKVKKSEKSLTLKCDITKEEDIISMIEEIHDFFGNIDVIVNNVGISIDNKIEKKSKEEFMKVLDTNLVSPFLVIKHALKYLKNAVIISIASTDGIDTYNEYNIDYSASKAGLINMTKSLAYAIEEHKFYCIAPNFVNTQPIQEMNPDFLENELKRVGQKELIEPEEVAKEVLRLLDKKEKSGTIVEMRGD